MFLIQSKINRSGFYRMQQGRVMWFVAQCLIHYLEYVCLWFVFIFPFLCRLSQINSYLLLFFVTGCHSLLFLHHLCWYWLRFWLFTVFSGLVSTNPWWGCENYFTILLLTLFQHYKFIDLHRAWIFSLCIVYHFQLLVGILWWLFGYKKANASCP